jgi:hypothetical protein
MRQREEEKKDRKEGGEEGRKKRRRGGGGERVKGGSILQGYSACLACSRPGFNPQHRKKKKDV